MYARIERSPSLSPAATRAHGATGQPLVRAAVFGLLGVLATWQERWRQRRLLESMDNRAMRDLALSRADIYREASKPFWSR